MDSSTSVAPPSPTLPLKGGGTTEQAAKRSSQRQSHPRRARRRASRRRASASKIDRSKYETVRTLDRLKAWVARAARPRRRRGRHRDHQPRSDAGASLRLLARSRRQRGLLRADRPPRGRRAAAAATCSRRRPSSAPTRFRKSDALAALKPLLEDPGVLKVGQNLKYDWQIFARRGIDMRPYDDTMLMSYVLDAGRGGHGMDDAGREVARPPDHPLRGRRRLRQGAGHLRLRADRQGRANTPPRTPT